MKSSITGLLVLVSAFLLISCKDEPLQNHLIIKNNTDKNIICSYYAGLNKDFVISADYTFTEFPQTIYFVDSAGVQRVDCFFSIDGKERDRTYQFIFFDGETLGKYTLSEIAERNLYDDLQILTFDQLRAANFSVTYSGPTVNK